MASKLEAKGSKLVPLSVNLVDEVWGSERPPRPASKVFALDIKYAGKNPLCIHLSYLSYIFLGRSAADKLKHVREKLDESNAYAVVVSMLDEVAWLFNLRGSDIA